MYVGCGLMLKADDFLGQWELQRSIRDHLNGQHGRLAGQVMFAARQPSHLSYDESGTLMLESGATLEATRQYLWQFLPDVVTVAFADGRPFHRFIPSGHAAGTDHPCGDDFYTVRYDFTKWPQWTAVWTVIGPRKDYVSTSTYQRR